MKYAIAAAALGLLALGGCNRSNPDQINEVETNQPAAEDLNALSDEAANVAAEAQALENQAEQLNREAQATDNAVGAVTPEDENIQGM